MLLLGSHLRVYLRGSMTFGPVRHEQHRIKTLRIKNARL